MAQLLGFENYAQYSLEPKMAKSPAEVLEFLRDLGARAKPYAERDLEEFQRLCKLMKQTSRTTALRRQAALV